MLIQAEIIQDPAAFVELDPEMAYTLLDLKRAVSSAPPCLSPEHLVSSGAWHRHSPVTQSDCDHQCVTLLSRASCSC